MATDRTQFVEQSVDRFRAEANRRRGFAPKNRYTVFLGIPHIIEFDPDGRTRRTQQDSVFDYTTDTSTVNVLCESVQILSRDVVTTEHTTYGRRRTVPSGASGTSLEMTFLLTNDYVIKNLFDRWIATIVNGDGSIVAYKEDVVGDITVRQLDQSNRFDYEAKFINCYPTKQNPLDLANTISDDFQRLSVSFDYDREQFVGDVPIGLDLRHHWNDEIPAETLVSNDFDIVRTAREIIF